MVEGKGPLARPLDDPAAYDKCAARSSLAPPSVAVFAIISTRTRATPAFAPPSLDINTHATLVFAPPRLCAVRTCARAGGNTGRNAHRCPPFGGLKRTSLSSLWGFETHIVVLPFGVCIRTHVSFMRCVPELFRWLSDEEARIRGTERVDGSAPLLVSDPSKLDMFDDAGAVKTVLRTGVSDEYVVHHSTSHAWPPQHSTRCTATCTSNLGHCALRMPHSTVG